MCIFRDIQRTRQHAALREYMIIPVRAMSTTVPLRLRDLSPTSCLAVHLGFFYALLTAGTVLQGLVTSRGGVLLRTPSSELLENNQTTHTRCIDGPMPDHARYHTREGTWPRVVLIRATMRTSIRATGALIAAVGALVHRHTVVSARVRRVSSHAPRR